MKDYSWLAVFSVFTLVVGLLFTYGNSTRADVDTPPVQVLVTSTTTPSSPIIIRGESTGSQFAPPVITVNVMIATSSLVATPQAAPKTSTKDTSPSYTYNVTNNTYAQEETTPPPAETSTITLSIEGVYTSTTTPITDGETILELLSRLDATDSALSLVTQDYGDMGVLVTALGGLVNGTDGNYWQYQVDGQVPMVGADQYELESGETVIWEFKGF